MAPESDTASTSPAEGAKSPSTVDGFASTCWSLVLAASKDDLSGPALDRLCRAYWKAIYTFARKSGLAPSDAEDATQDFFAFLLARSWLQQASPERGSFRAFLLTLFQNFLSNRRQKDRAQKRGGGTTIISVHASDGENEVVAIDALGLDPASAYDRVWANCVLQSTLARLAKEQETAGKPGVFEALRPFLTQRPGPGDYERVGQQLGLPRNQVAVMIHRLSRRFAELIRAEVAETLSDRGGVEQELRHLLKALS